MLRCEVCCATFSSNQALTNHLTTKSHQDKQQAQEEATRIWNLFHLLRGPTIPRFDLRESLQEGKRRNPNLKEIVPLGEGTKVPEAKRGTVECKVAKCKGSAHPFLGGLQPWIVFTNNACKINGKFDCSTTFFNYKLTCVAHPLYQYDGKMSGNTVSVAHYICGKHFIIRNLKEKLSKLVDLENGVEAELVQAILSLRSDNDNSCYDSYLHFCRSDCHPLFMRMHVTATYGSDQEVNANEAHQQQESDSTKYWLGSHNRVNEKGLGKKTVDNSRNKRCYAPPVAFVMLAPMSTREELDSWMGEHGLNREFAYAEDYLISSYQKPTSAATTSPSVDFIDASDFTTDPIAEEALSILQVFYPESVNINPNTATVCAESLKDMIIANDRKKKNHIADLGS